MTRQQEFHAMTESIPAGKPWTVFKSAVATVFFIGAFWILFTALRWQETATDTQMSAAIGFATMSRGIVASEANSSALAQSLSTSTSSLSARLTTETSRAYSSEQAVLNGQKPPFSLDQFVPVARVAVDVVSLVVRADSPYKTYQDFAAALKANPKGMTYSSSGNYGISHFPAEMLLAATQSEARHIPYSGGAPMLTALMGGQVDFNIPVRTLALPHVQSGRLRYLAMYGAKRWSMAPDVPTLAELGVPIEFVPWTGLFAPSGTPSEVLSSLRKALRAASQDPQFVETVGKSSAGEIAYLDGAELETFWKADLARTSATTQRIGRVQ
jgi:tripartite-type tricarboxylate transporter receptor subunit TctC